MAQPVPQLQSKFIDFQNIENEANHQYPSKHQLLRLLFLHRRWTYYPSTDSLHFGSIAPLYVSLITNLSCTCSATPCVRACYVPYARLDSRMSSRSSRIWRRLISKYMPLCTLTQSSVSPTHLVLSPSPIPFDPGSLPTMYNYL